MSRSKLAIVVTAVIGAPLDGLVLRRLAPLSGNLGVPIAAHLA